jgi:hypothetical protein
MKNLTIIILTLIFLSHCGYSTVYKNQKSINFEVNITETTGDNEINNLIKNEIKLYSNKDSQNIYDAKIKSSYTKKILTKNISGSITDYNLSVTSIFTIEYKNENKTFRFEENINIKNRADTFEQKLYEKNIKRNFASSIRKKFVLAIMSLDDN